MSSDEKKEVDAEVLADLKAHMSKVRDMLNMFRSMLRERTEGHDDSKMQEPEWEYILKYTPKLWATTYGSPEYFANLEEMRPGLEHHYANNPHHPEFFDNGIDDMTLIDLMEMFCDWLAAVMRHKDGNIMRSIEINKDRFKISPQLVSILQNTAEVVAVVLDSHPKPEPVTHNGPIAPNVLQNLLLLVSIEVEVEEIETWSEEMRELAATWAGAVHLSASDNDDIEVPDKPEFLPPEQSWPCAHRGGMP